MIILLLLSILANIILFYLFISRPKIKYKDNQIRTIALKYEDTYLIVGFKDGLINIETNDFENTNKKIKDLKAWKKPLNEKQKKDLKKYYTDDLEKTDLSKGIDH